MATTIPDDVTTEVTTGGSNVLMALNTTQNHEVERTLRLQFVTAGYYTIGKADGATGVAAECYAVGAGGVVDVPVPSTSKRVLVGSTSANIHVQATCLTRRFR